MAILHLGKNDSNLGGRHEEQDKWMNSKATEQEEAIRLGICWTCGGKDINMNSRVLAGFVG